MCLQVTTMHVNALIVVTNSKTERTKLCRLFLDRLQLQSWKDDVRRNGERERERDIVDLEETELERSCVFFIS